MKLCAALTLLILPATLSQSLAQNPGQNPAQPSGLQNPTIASESTLVLVPALVRDKDGGLIFGLNAGDFTLTDDGIPQKLHLEEDTGGAPLALVVVIEANSASKSAGWRLDGRDAPPNRYRTLITMIDALLGNVPRKIAVVAFDSQPTLLQEFTSNITRTLWAPPALENCAAPAPSRETMEPPSSTPSASPSISSATSPHNIDAPFFSSARPSTAAATSPSTKPSTPSATPTPSSTASDSPPASPKPLTTPPAKLPTTPIEPHGSLRALENRHPNPPNGLHGQGSGRSRSRMHPQQGRPGLRLSRPTRPSTRPRQNGRHRRHRRPPSQHPRNRRHASPAASTSSSPTPKASSRPRHHLQPHAQSIRPELSAAITPPRLPRHRPADCTATARLKVTARNGYWANTKAHPLALHSVQVYLWSGTSGLRSWPQGPHEATVSYVLFVRGTRCKPR